MIAGVGPPAAAPGELDWRADLEAYLRAAWDFPAVAIDAVAPFGDGHSGFTYALDIRAPGRDGRYVIRLSPPHARITGTADIGRQGRIMAALRAAGLPTPSVLAMDGRPAIGGRSFALMTLVSGDDFDTALGRCSARDLAAAALDLHRRMRALPLGATGIGDEPAQGPGDELARWSALADRAPDWVRRGTADLARALAATCPPAEEPHLVHGDYHFGNMRFAEGRVVLLVDWEIAELGDPLLDLGSLALASLRRRYLPDPNTFGNLEVPIAELVAGAGASPDRARWFVALSCYKYVAIIGYNLTLHLSGKRPDPIYERLTATTTGLLEDGLAILRDGIDGW